MGQVMFKFPARFDNVRGCQQPTYPQTIRTETFGYRTCGDDFIMNPEVNCSVPAVKGKNL